MEGRWQGTRHLSIAALFDFVEEVHHCNPAACGWSSPPSIVSVLTGLADSRLAGIARTQPFFSTFSF